MTRTAVEEKVVDGPSKLDLVMSVIEGDCTQRRTVEFTVINSHNKQPGKVTVAIDMMEREDGSGESWNLRGRITATEILYLTRCKEVRFHFSSKRRKGSLFHYA